VVRLLLTNDLNRKRILYIAFDVSEFLNRRGSK